MLGMMTSQIKTLGQTRPKKLKNRGVTIWTLYKILLHWRRKVQVYKRQKNIVVIETAEDWNKFYDNFIVDKDVKVIGFDCEWVFEGHRRHPVSLLQIATQHGDCALIRILNFYPNIPESLKNVLANRRILKVGVAAKDDGQKLLHDFGLEVYGCVDLRFLLNRIRGLYKCKTRGLQGLSQGVLGIKMKKDVKIRCGNWEAQKLSPQQIEYAADDAIIAVDIFTHLILAKMNGKKPNLKDVSDTGLYITETGFWEIAKSMCQGILDVGFKWRSMPLDVTQGTGDLIDDCVAETHTQKERQNLDPKSVQPVVKNPRAYVTRKRPLYYNCSLLAPDGEMLCTCDIRKAEWYIMKGLADKVSDDPLTVKLRFEPSGRPNDELIIIYSIKKTFVWFVEKTILI
ncbi:hypothetical protein KUTeg_005603 [Tegillarca granosa]|uniref:3'-5' exonuclease domain-containing protein n=1 Tax=Tegillarca granosa TaxID=220873 RepID=A0ABQ9FK81_TEGGR|nr:hypothetical protein KUTeg_005603 [Tegillarca granosa]